MSLSPEHIAQISHALDDPRLPDWSAPPIVPGDWEACEGELAYQIVTAASAALSTAGGTPLGIAYAVDRVRMMPFPVYPRGRLIELQGHAGPDRPGLICLLLTENRFIKFDGSSRPIHALNEELPPDLSTPELREAYLQLFMNWVRGELGRFQPVETVEDIEALCLPDETLPELDHLLEPVTEVSPPDDEAKSEHTLTLVYGTDLFQATMKLSATGNVDMLEDQILHESLPLRLETLVGPMVTLA